LVDIAVSINDQKSVKNQMPPLLGEHTEEVLRSAGYSDAELKVFRDEGITN